MFWTFADYEVTDTPISLQCIHCDVEIADLLYTKVTFEPIAELG